MTYTESITTGFFTGIGVIFAQTVFELWIKPKIVKIHKMQPRINIGNIMQGELEINTTPNKTKKVKTNGEPNQTNG